MNTNQEFSDRLKISKTMVSYILRGLRGVSWDVAKKAAKAYGKSPSWWMEARPSELQRVMRNGGK